MATKKKNRRYVVRQVRRALNASLDFFKQAGGRRLNGHGYGTGILRKNMRDTSREAQE